MHLTACRIGLLGTALLATAWVNIQLVGVRPTTLLYGVLLCPTGRIVLVPLYLGWAKFILARSWPPAKAT